MNKELYDLNSQSECLNKADELGFKTNPERRVCKGIENVIDYINNNTDKQEILHSNVDLKSILLYNYLVNLYRK